jgi:hypothetical protein
MKLIATSRPKFESRYQVYPVSGNVMDLYMATPLYENTSQELKHGHEVMRKIVDESLTDYEKVIYDMYFIKYNTVTAVSEALQQNLKTVYQRVHKIKSIIKILFPLYILEDKVLKDDLVKKFTEEERIILENLKYRYNIKACVRRTGLSFDKVKKVRMKANRCDPNDSSPCGVYLNVIRQLNALRRELRVD